MNKSAGHRAFPTRYLWFIALVGLPVVAWLGILDAFSSSTLGDSLSSAGVIYGTARGINALVSLLQGTELDFVFVTFSIGEVLDPINDLIERFSQLILIALGSLALQTILLNVVSDAIFNALLSVAALAAGVSLLLGHARTSGPLLKTFLLFVFLRFSLGLVVLANGWVDDRFLTAEDVARHQAMEEFRGELREIDSVSQEQKQAAIELAAAQAAQRDFLQERNALVLAQDNLNQRMIEKRQSLDVMIKEAGSLCTSWDIPDACPANVKHAKTDFRTLAAEQEERARNINSLDSSVQDLQEKIACLTKRERGDSCKFWEKLPTPPDVAAMREKIESINTGVSDFSENTINLLVSLLLKTVAIPLLFIYLLLLVLRKSWSRL